MKNRRKTAEGYQRWMMKANTGAAAAAAEGGGGGGGSRKKVGNEEDMEADSDRGEDDMDDEEARKTRLGMNKSAKGGDEDGEEPANEHDLDDEEPERGKPAATLGLLFQTLVLIYAFCWRDFFSFGLLATNETSARIFLCFGLLSVCFFSVEF